MASVKRSSVFIALSNTVGHDLVFQHHTAKVIVARHPETNKGKSQRATKTVKKKNETGQ